MEFINETIIKGFPLLMCIYKVCVSCVLYTVNTVFIKDMIFTVLKDL